MQVAAAQAAPRGQRLRHLSPFRLIIAAVLVAAAVSAWVLTRPSTPAYRTAAVGRGAAVATLTSVGTVTPVNQSDLSFPVAGTVGDVNVTVGQQVTPGEVVASLETTPLENDVVTADATLAADQATLASDEARQAAASAASAATSPSAGTTSSAAPSTGAGTSTPTTAPPTSASSTASSQQIARLQATLLADQKRLDTDSAAAGATLAQATAACATPPAPAASKTSGGPGSSGSSGAPTGTGSGHPASSCSTALAQASAAQSAVATDITTVQKDEAALNTALGGTGSGSGGTTTGSPGRGSGSPGAGQSSTTTTTHPATTTTTGHGTGGASNGSKGGSSNGSASSGSSSGGSSPSAGSGASSRPVTPEKLALDQADIDVAQVGLADAQRALADANLVSTIAGTVASVTVTGGESVQAGSSSGAPQIVVIGAGSSYQVSTTVPVTAISRVVVGQSAQVTPDSGNAVLMGKVTAVGVLGTSTSTSTTYPVTISLESYDLGPFSGAEATVSIVTQRAVDVTTVPTSAVRTVGSAHLVSVVAGSKVTQVPVKIGTVGAELTQILSGVTVGQRVSLAAMDQPVPTSSTTRGGLAGLGGAVSFEGGGSPGGGGSFNGGSFKQVAGG